MKSKKKISAEHLEHFKAVNKRLGLPEDTETHDGSQTPQTLGHLCKEGKDTIVYSSNPEKSDVPPMLIPVKSIAHLNELIGVPDHFDDKHIVYPPPLAGALSAKVNKASSPKDLIKSMTTNEHDNIRQAMEAYVMGNSEKVKDYEGLINRTALPKQVAYFASTDPLVIDKPVVVQGDDPVVWNYSSITMEDNGSLTAQAPMNITASELISEGKDKIITANAENYDGKNGNPSPNAPDGTDGNDGGSGQQGSSAKCGTDSSIKGTPATCVTPPGDGKTGGNGTDGSPGQPGLKGRTQSPFFLTIKEVITGNLIVQAGGGNGQNGGNGGKGGDGGPGGAAGNNCGPCTKAAAGQQGPAGKGGDAGAAGDGGDGSTVQIYYKQVDGDIQQKNVGGAPGNPGKEGSGGKGIGGGGNGGPGAQGKPGKLSVITIGPIPTS